jgi:hypothetical protein
MESFVADLSLKAKIAMKTHRIQEKCVERSQVQDKWVNFASELSNAIHDLNTIQVCVTTMII